MIIRYIKLIAVLVALFLINACGGGSSGTDTGTATSMAASQKEVTLFEANPIKILKSVNENLRSVASVSGGKAFTTLVVFRKELNGNYRVKMHDFSFNVEGCTVTDLQFDPSILTMDGNAGSLYRLSISGKIDNECAENSESRSYVVGSTMDVILGGKTTSKKSDFSSSEAGQDEASPSQGYVFYNASTPLKISEANKQYKMKVQLLKDGYIVVGANIILKPFDAKYGNVAIYSVQTGSDGYAVFDYTSPAKLPTNGTSTTLEVNFFNENNQTISENIILDFNKIGGGGVLYALANETSPVIIKHDKEVKDISVDVLDKNTNIGVEGINVSITAVKGIEFGAIVGGSTVATDSSGHAVFKYQAPADISAVDGKTTTVTLSMVDNGVVLKKDVNITFKTDPTTIKVTQIYVTPKKFTVLKANEKHSIKITALDVANRGVSATFKIENPVLNGVDYGSFGLTEFTTDASGNADINYTAPSSIDSLSERSITIVEVSSQLETNLTITFQQPVVQEKLYDIDLTTQNFIKVDGDGILGISIHEHGKPNILIDDVNVIDVNLTMKMPKMLTFYGGDKNVTYRGSNTKSYKIFAQKYSGVAIVKVSATVFDGKKNVTLTKEYPVVILSGSIASMSMFHARSDDADPKTGLYKDYYTIHAVDKYGNPVSAGTALHPTLINRSEITGKNGKIYVGTPTKFDYTGSVVDNQRVIIIPSIGKTDKHYLGDWSIKGYTATQLEFDEQYGGDDNVSDLTYVIGDENRVIDGKIVTADISSPDGSFVTDDQGNLEFVVTYDPRLKGEFYFLAANADSNGTRIGVALKSSFYYGGYQLQTLISDIYVSSPGDSFTTGFYLLDATGHKVDNYNARVEHFDTKKGSFSVSNIFRELSYTAPQNSGEFHALVGTTYEFNLTIAEGVEPVQPITVHFVDNTDYSNYSLVTADSNFTISNPNQSQQLKFYLKNGDSVVPYQRINIDFIDPLRGSMDKYSVTSDWNGMATFIYTSPSDIASLNGQTLNIRAYFDANSSIEANATAYFDVTGGKDYTGYKITVVPVDSNVSVPNEKQVIQVYLEDNNTLPAANEEIYILDFNRSTGSMNQYVATTDENGYTVFEYTAPAPVIGLDTTFNVTMKNSSVVTTGVHIGYSPQTVPQVDTTGMTLYVQPSDFNITTAGEEKALSVYLSKSNAPVAGVEVSANFFDPANGTLNTYSGTTNASGQVVFNYTAPETLPAGPLTITFDVVNASASIAQTATVNFVSSSPVDTTGMTLYVQPSDFNITTAGEEKALSVYLSKSNAPVAGVEVSANFFDPANGTLNTYSGTTNASGQVVFNYTAPETLPAGPLTITFDVVNADTSKPSVAKNVLVHFVKLANYTYNISSEANITVTQVATTYPISVALSKKDENNNTYPAIGEKVIAEFIQPVKGSLSSYEVTVANNGIAAFEYISPDKTLPSSDLNITFYYKEDRNETNTTIVHFVPQGIDEVKHLYLAPQTITISAANEDKNITLITVNDQNFGLQADIKLENPYDGNTSTDYGSFDRSSVTTSTSGSATVVYTAPDDITGLVERNITVDVVGTSITSELHIKFVPSSGSTQYEIVPILPDALEVDGTGNIGIKIVEIGNSNNIIDDGDVVEVNLTSQMPDMLLFTDGSTVASYSDVAENTQIGVETKTQSGVVIINVNATVYDGINNVTISKSIAVTIISGPVSAMSLVYVGSGSCSLGLPASKYLIHAVDKYSNPAQQIQITPTLINGIKFQPTRDSGTADINGSNPAVLTETNSSKDFNAGSNPVTPDDRLIIVANAQKYDQSYVGNWGISDVRSSNELDLNETYTGTDDSNLSYAVGNEKRILGNNLYVADIISESGQYATDENGVLELQVCFDPPLAGHTVVLGAYTIDRGQRIGTAAIETLRWGAYTSSGPVEFDNDGATHTIGLTLGIGGNAPSHLMDVDIAPSSFVVKTKPHCKIDYTNSDFHTDRGGQVRIVVNTDNNQTATGGVDNCSVDWDKNPTSVLYEY